MKTGKAPSPLMRDLSTYIARAGRKRLPADVMEQARIHFVDTVAAMISGSRLLPGKKALAYVKTLGGKPEACIVGTRLLTSAPNAALVHGMFAHADETDDVHPASRTHPGAGIVPCVLAVSERARLSGATMLRGMVLGYEICARLLLSINWLYFREAGHSASPFGQVFGAASAAAALMELDAAQVRYVLSYAAQQAAGLNTVLRDTEHVEKSFMLGGLGAHNGTAAALMVASGFTGVEDVFAGDHNFFDTFAPKADRAVLTRDLGKHHEILNCGIKRWPAGGPIQGPLHVLSELMQENGISARDIEEWVLRMPHTELATVDNREMPDICLQHLLALMLIDGKLTFHSAHDFGRMRDPRVLAVRKRLRVIPDPELTDPLRRFRADLTVRLKDGRELSRRTLSAKGSFDNPLLRHEEEEKALDLIGPVLGVAKSKKLLATLWKVDQLDDVRSLRKLLTA